MRKASAGAAIYHRWRGRFPLSPSAPYALKKRAGRAKKTACVSAKRNTPFAAAAAFCFSPKDGALLKKAAAYAFSAQGKVIVMTAPLSLRMAICIFPWL